MKRFYLLMAIIIAFTININAEAPQFVKASKSPILLQEGKNKNWCPICGMSLKMFYKTSHSIETKDGKKLHFCSIRCLANTKFDKNSKISVVDVKTEKMIDAKKAYYVVGSKVQGTMAMVSKLAFEKEQDAKEFKSIYGGEIVDFKKAFEMAKKSLEVDNKKRMKKITKKIIPMGKKIYTKKCTKIDISKLDTISDIKTYIIENNICKNLNPKQLQATALYLKSTKLVTAKNRPISVTKDEKCPVCGMFIYKYPVWATQIHFNNNNKPNHYSFDGVKDMMKFYLEPKKYNQDNLKITKLLVTNYYTNEAIDAKKAFFVIGSDIFGPMGHELIPFSTLDEAENFLKDHNGKSIISFDKITTKMVFDLDK